MYFLPRKNSLKESKSYMAVLKQEKLYVFKYGQGINNRRVTQQFWYIIVTNWSSWKSMNGPFCKEQKPEQNYVKARMSLPALSQDEQKKKNYLVLYPFLLIL